MNDFSNLIIRWTFGETEARPTSLQAFDMLECSILYAKKLFPNAKRYIVYNSLKSKRTLEQLTRIAHEKAELIEAKSNWNYSTKNSFWKYIPLRIDKTKYEIVLDSDIVFWNIPATINIWLKSNGLLINTDWNGRNYGDYEKLINKPFSFNAGIIGYPPLFEFELPNIENFKEKFLTEQGYITHQFISSNLKLFVLNKSEIFQSNVNQHINHKIENIIDNYSGGHFCGCNFSHYQHWDKFCKDEIWKYNEVKIDILWNFRDISKFNSKIKQGIIYRSSALCLYKEDMRFIAILEKYNIESVIDLRANRELKECNYSNEQKSNFNIVHAPFDPWSQSLEFQNTYNTGTNAEIAYQFFSLECKPSIKKIVETVLKSKGAVDIHCHAGKDRTGIAITLLHLLSGADKNEIFLDYLASEMDTKKSYLQIFLDIVIDTGGIEKYLQTCKLSEIQIDELKQKICQ